MILGATVDAGAPLEVIISAIDSMNVKGVSITCQNAQRAGLNGKLVEVHLDEQAKRSRSIQEFVDTVEGSGLSETVIGRAKAVFRRLEEAEARVHQTPIEGVHLHELGTLDTLVDVVGGIVGLDSLGIDRLYSSPFPTGSGVIKTEHGVLPVPAPATSALMALAKAPMVPAPGGATRTGEMVTPTGAAIITTLATFRQPAMNLENIGYGLGSREARDYPNALALWIGEENGGSYTNELILIETNVDDMTGELLGYAQELLFDMGARDVWFTPIQMKKSRPATMVSVIVSRELEAPTIEILMRETTTLGVRVRPLSRYQADREQATAVTALGEVSVKIKLLNGVAIAASPEYEDCKRIAQEQGMPLQEVYRIVKRDAEAQLLEG